MSIRCSRLDRNQRRIFGQIASALLFATACASAPVTPPETGHTRDPEPARGPLVHRFEHAEQWAKQFDDPARDAWQRPQEVVAALMIRPGMTVADIGAGTGYFEPWLSRAVGGSGMVLALDIE